METGAGQRGLEWFPAWGSPVCGGRFSLRLRSAALPCGVLTAVTVSGSRENPTATDV